jgi:hypothetical protein
MINDNYFSPRGIATFATQCGDKHWPKTAGTYGTYLSENAWYRITRKMDNHIKMQEKGRISVTYTHLRKTEGIEAVWNGQGL